MGILKREYTLAEALNLIKTDTKGKNQYTPVPVDPDNPNTKYRLEKTKKLERKFARHITKNSASRSSNSNVRQYANSVRQQQQEFKNRVNGNGKYMNSCKPQRNYNDYQSTKGYRKSTKQDYR